MAPEVSFYSNFDNAWGFPLLNDPGMRAAVSIVATQYNKPIWQTEDSNLDGGRFIRPGSVLLPSTSSNATLQITAVRPRAGM